MNDRINKLRTYLGENPSDAFLNHALALEYIKLGYEQEALAHFRANHANHPEYVATYYHLGKLLERMGQTDEAIRIYEQGMGVARAAGELLSFNELRSVYEELTF